MNKNDFTSAIWVEQNADVVFKTILDVRSWWSGLFDESFTGSSENLGDEFRFVAGGGMHQSTQKLVELVPDKKITWEVTDANLSFVKQPDEWKGTRIEFEMTEENEGTKIVFRHAGLNSSFQCYESCAPAWTQYIHQQLPTALKKASS